MARDENLTALLVHDSVDARLVGGGQDLQFRNGGNVLPQHRGVTGMGYIELVVKASEQNGLLVIPAVGIDAEELLGQGVLVDAVVVVQARLGAPADVEHGMNMGLAPLHDLAQLRPVVHFLEGHLLHRRAGDDHAVEFAVLDLIKGLVEGQQVLLGDVLGLVGGGVHQFQLHLQGRIAQKAGQLGLGGDLGGHEVQQQQLQRTDVLGGGSLPGHDENILLLQRFSGGQVIGDPNGHGGPP